MACWYGSSHSWSMVIWQTVPSSMISVGTGLVDGAGVSSVSGSATRMSASVQIFAGAYGT